MTITKKNGILSERGIISLNEKELEALYEDIMTSGQREEA